MENQDPIHRRLLNKIKNAPERPSHYGGSIEDVFGPGNPRELETIIFQTVEDRIQYQSEGQAREFLIVLNNYYNGQISYALAKNTVYETIDAFLERRRLRENKQKNKEYVVADLLYLVAPVIGFLFLNAPAEVLYAGLPLNLSFKTYIVAKMGKVNKKFRMSMKSLLVNDMEKSLENVKQKVLPLLTNNNYLSSAKL